MISAQDGASGKRVSSEGIRFEVAETAMSDEFLCMLFLVAGVGSMARSESKTSGQQAREHTGALEDHETCLEWGRYRVGGRKERAREMGTRKEKTKRFRVH